MPRCWLEASSSMASTSSAPSHRIQAGKLEKGRASRKVHSLSTGRKRLSLVLPASKVYFLAAENQSGIGRELQSTLFRARLHTLSFSPFMHAIKAGAAYRRPAKPRISRSASGDAKATDNRGVPYRLCPRAGIESTHAQAIRRSGLRHARYRGLTKTHLKHVLTAAAINTVRIASWAHGTPIARTRRSHFAALQIKAA
jgi:hypothetical protein